MPVPLHDTVSSGALYKAPKGRPFGAQTPVAVGRFTPGYDPMADPDPFNSKGASRVAFSTEVPKGAFASMGLGAGAGAVPNGGGPQESYDTAGLPPWAQELFHGIQEFNAKGLQVHNAFAHVLVCAFARVPLPVPVPPRP